MGTKFDRQKLLQEIKNDPELLRRLLKQNPALLDYIFSDAKIGRKYVKIPADMEDKLKKVSHESGVPEGTLIGLGIVLLLKNLKVVE